MAEKNIVDTMTEFKEKYYNDNKKNIFFKKTQKIDCAKELTALPNFNLEEAIKNTAYIFPETNKIFINYELFKLYAHCDNYEVFINYLMFLYKSCTDSYGKFEVHVNLNTFSVTSAERYKEAIIMFNNKCIETNSDYSDNVIFMKIYNTPAVMDQIKIMLKPFIDKRVFEKIVLISKKDTPVLLEKLMNNNIIKK